MDLATQRLMSGAAGAGGDKTYVDDVFSTFLYTGNASDKTITNSIDLAGEGGLVWIKRRDAGSDHALVDTERGASQYLSSNSTAGNVATGANNNFNSFTSTGFTLKDDNGNDYFNKNNTPYASWSFRKAPGFFDIVTYTGSGSTQTLSHSLESTPGMILVKRLDTSTGWGVYHRGQVGYDGGTKAEDYRLLLDSTTYSNNDTYWGDTAPTTTQFTVGDAHTEVNASGGNYVAYIFAHDEQSFGKSADSSVIKCGNYTGNGSTNGPEVNVGWEPQWIMVKRTDGGTGLWLMADNMRGVVNGGNDPYLQANGNNGEYTSYDWIEFTPTGFKLTNTGVSLNSNGDNYVYTAIRRPDGYVGKPVELGTDVFAMDTAASTTPNFDSGFPVDFTFIRTPASNSGWYTGSRLTSGKLLYTNASSSETSHSEMGYYDYNEAYGGGGWWDANVNQAWMWKRHAGFDVVAYKSDELASGQLNHSLGKIPEMIWFKSRDANQGWGVWHKGLNGGSNSDQYYLRLDSTNSETGGSSNTDRPLASAPTSTHISLLSTSTFANYSTDKYIAMFFASVEGISKVGSYSGQSSNLTLDLGFQPRFFLCKRVNTTGDFVMFDTVRGFGSGNDQRIKLNSVDAQDAYDQGSISSTGITLIAGVANYVLSTSSSDKYIYYSHA